MALILAALAASTAAAAESAGTAAGGTATRFGAAIEVARIVTAVRVVDRFGQPVIGLSAADFSVRIGGRPAAVESVAWVGGATAPRGESASGTGTGSEAAAGPPAVSGGRLLVLLFQSDLIPSRLSGLQRMSRRSARILDALGPDDRVAVAVLGSRLRLHADFTADRERLRRELDVPELLSWREAGPSPDGPSLARHLDAEDARRASSLERALLAIARALAPLPGRKSVVLFAWGLGRLTSTGVHLGREYEQAVAALAAADATVFALDITDADSHSLELGLRAVAEQTGGFYARTHEFPAVALARLEGALAGRYELTLVKPGLPAGSHPLAVRVSAARATVYARPALTLD